MKLTTLIIDDESLARQRIQNLAMEVVELDVVDMCNTGKDAIKKINSLEPDLIFLDIKLKDMTGFDILEKITISKKPLVIFVTAYDKFALKAFDCFAFDYLLKPFKDERFFTSVNKAIELVKQEQLTAFEHKIDNLLHFMQSQKQATHTTPIQTKLSIKLGNKVTFINTSDIKYILASGYYAEIYTSEKTYLLRESLSNLITKLDPNFFIRIHRSTIININFINELIHSNYGEIDVKTTDNKLFRISKSYKKDFQNLMGL